MDMVDKGRGDIACLVPFERRGVEAFRASILNP